MQINLIEINKKKKIHACPLEITKGRHTQNTEAATQHAPAHKIIGCFLFVESLHDPHTGKISKTGKASITLFHIMYDAASF